MRSAPTWFEYLEAKGRANPILSSDIVQIDLRKFRVVQPIEVEHSTMTDAQRLLFGMGLVSK